VIAARTGNGAMGETMMTTIGSRPEPHLRRLMWVAALASMVLLAGWAARADAAAVWRLDATSETLALAGGQFRFYVDVVNAGDVSTDGTTYTLTVTLPPGMRGVSANGFSCPGVAGATVVVCPTTFPLNPHEKRMLTLTVDVDAAASGILTARYDITGGRATPASTVDPVTVTSDPTPPLFGIDAFDARVDRDAAGTALTQAGGHPYAASTSFDVTTATDPSPFVAALRPIEPVKDIQVDLPPGFIGNPTAAATCTIPELANNEGPIVPKPLCAPASQIGTALVRHSGQGEASNTIGPLPVFNMVPPPDAPARFGFNAFGTLVVLDARLRSGSDYGITATVKNASEGLALIGSTVTLWGVPSDPSHDLERACSGEQNPWDRGPTCRSGAPPAAFLRNPTSCNPDPNVGLPTTLKVDSWTHPGAFQEATIESHLPPAYPFAPVDWGAPRGPDGCENVPFDPRLDGQPLAGSKAGQPAGFAFDLTLPQTDAFNSIGESDLKKAVVTLPEGVRVNPSSADGLAGCSSAQIALRSTADPTCPVASKLGDVTIETPLLKDPLTGGIYLATPFDNPSGSLVALYIVVRGQGVTIKVSGSSQMDPVTGQITATFDNNPQAPFSRLHIQFKGGPRAPLTLPNRCGTFTTHAELTGWNGRVVPFDSSFTVSENAKGLPCPAEFTPGFSAGTKSNSAGTKSSFLLRVSRDDEDQQVKGLTVNLPSGLTGYIANVDLCPDAAANVGGCPAGSKIGDVTVGAGAGSNPFFITNGRAYLTGPYKGAPFGVAIDVPAVAGPFNLGLVTVRSALFVDKHDATVRIVSDPLPQILQGIPLDTRDVRVNVNRPDFFVNPTSCAVKTIGATVESVEGVRAAVSDRFQAVECAGLAFKPRLTLRVGGRGHTARNRTTPLTATLTMPRGGANLRSARVMLPKAINARLTVIQDACTRAEFEADISKCDHARAGTARAVTPLLREPLTGNAYFVKNGHGIPDLFVALRGQIDFDLIGRITIVRNTFLTNTFASAPDVPVTSFTLKLFGDPKNGSVGAAANLCSAKSRRQKAELDLVGHNGKVRRVKQALQVAGCPKVKKHTARRHGRKR
jgi:hypothetical protein